MDEQQKVTLSTIARGAAEELFQVELQEILENIHNVNTDPESKRSITIQLVFAPNEERTQIAVGVAVKKNIAAVRGASTTLYTGDMKKEGKFQVVEYNPKQMRITEIVGCAHPTSLRQGDVCGQCGEELAGEKA